MFATDDKAAWKWSASTTPAATRSGSEPSRRLGDVRLGRLHEGLAAQVVHVSTNRAESIVAFEV